MQRPEVETKVLAILHEQWTDAGPDTDFAELGWDSIDRIDLVMRLEEVFDIELDDDATYDLQSVRKVVDYVAAVLPQEVV